MNKTSIFQTTIPQLLQIGAHVGRSHHEPMMGEGLQGVRNGTYVIDLEQTESNLRRSAQFLHALASQGGHVLFVDPTPGSKALTRAAAKACNQSVLAHGWIGGFLTNGHSVSNELALYHQLQQYPHTQGTNLPQYRRMKNRCSGLRQGFTKPDALILVNVGSCKVAVAEATALCIPVVAIVDGHESSQGITYPIPGNPKSLRFLHHCLHTWTQALQVESVSMDNHN